MLEDDVVTVPAGWYPDPMGLPQLRWWDNHSWTEFTSATRAPLIVQDEPRLAYADDDLPSRRSQREQRTAAGAGRQQPMSKAELMSTLRELEPPKPQQIERNQPAPTAPVQDDADEALRREAQQAAQQQAAEQQAAQQRAAEQQAAQQAAQQRATEQQAQQARQAYEQQSDFSQPSAGQPNFSQPGAGQPNFSQPDPAGSHPGQQRGYTPSGYPQQPQGFSSAPAADPFADFVQAGEEPRPARASANYPDAGGFAQGSGQPGYGNPMAQPGYAYSRANQRRLDRSQVIYTPTVWALAMLPLIQMVVILLTVSSGVQSVPPAVPLGIYGAVYAAAIVLAFFDRRSLLAAGHHAPAHWALAFLTAPVYLVARAVATNREFGKGITPVVVWVSLMIIQALSVLAVPGILISAMPDAFKSQVEQSITNDAAIVGTALAVECPSPAVQIGVQFTCIGTTESGSTVEIAVSLQRSNGWIDWRVDSQIWKSGALD